MKNLIKPTLLFILVCWLVSCNNSTNEQAKEDAASDSQQQSRPMQGIEQEAEALKTIPQNSTGYSVIVGKDTLVTSYRDSTITATVNLPYTYSYSIRITDTIWKRFNDGGTTPPPNNKVPTANAGSDKSVTLPTNSVALTGTASDPDGTISSYLWSKVSGDVANINPVNAANTTITGLVQGTYVFKLTVIDNQGASASDNVTVTVSQGTSTSFAVEGYGVDAVGGANSSNVYHVTSLSSSGAGSLAAGIGSNKTIVFDVEGVIRARLYVSNASYLTIDAYSGKKDITIESTEGDVLSVENSHHIVIRGLRFRHVGSDGNDCLNVIGSSNNVVIDHCTSAGAFDGNIDLAATSSSGRGFTVQWCMMYGDRGSGNMLITTQNASVHHNLFIGTQGGESSERNPYAHSNYSPKGSQSSPNFDFRNNLLNAAGRYVSGNGYGAVGNYVNNYYTSNKAGLINLCADNASCGTAYVSGNFNQATASGGTKVSTEYSVPAKNRITTTDAKTAARAVLQSAGTYKKTPEEIKMINAITIAQ